MTPLISFLLKANIALILLYGFYFLCFRRDTFYGNIRWYLLATMISLIIFPLIDISALLTGSAKTLEVSQYISDAKLYYVFTQPQMGNAVELATAQTIPFGVLVFLCWISVTTLLIGKRLFQFISIIKLWYRNPKNHYGNCIIVSVEKKIQPFSFIRYIFLNLSLYTKDELDEIITHEQVHCRQGHSFDILLVEILVCLFWFNPFIWLLRRDIKQNIEYYTDRMTLMSGFDRKHYQYSLLRVSNGNYQIVNNFHFNNIKKRIIMMNKKESPRIMSAKYLLALPILATALLIVQISGLQAKETSITENVQQDIFSKSSLNKPLILIDGKEISDEEFSKIAPSSIESISILKDETAKNIYGEKANNGVIIISTKRETNFVNLKKTYSEPVQVNGTVTYMDGNGIPGAAVYVKGGKTGTVTDLNGKYSINVPADTSLIFTYIGMKTQEIRTGGRQVINVSLDSSTPSNDNKNLENILKVSDRSGNTDSCYFIVDGKEANNPGDISPNDIESISVLKGDNATKLYGEKGKNGVVIISTKKQKE